MWDGVDRIVRELLDGRLSISTGVEFTEDLGFGPATFIAPRDVHWMATTLADVSDESLLHSVCGGRHE